jgi:hypothetical protein
MGAIFLALGLLLMFASKIPVLGKLPGDLVFRRGHFTFYLPLASSLLLSFLLSLLLWVFRR